MYNLLLEVVSENAGLVENSIDADETPHSVVLSGSTLFDQARLSEYIRNTLKIAGLVENRLDAHETPHFAVSSGPTLFAQACLSEYIPNRWNSHGLCI